VAPKPSILQMSPFKLQKKHFIKNKKLRKLQRVKGASSFQLYSTDKGLQDGWEASERGVGGKPLF